MIFVLGLLLYAEWIGIIVLILLLGALGFAEMARANRTPKTAGASIADLPSARMTYWHVVAVILVIGNVLTMSYGLACTVATSDGCTGFSWGMADGLGFIFAELLLWLITLPALFGPMYAVRLHRHGVRAADLIGLGVILLPVSALTITWLVEPETNAGSLFVFGVAGMVLFLLGLLAPGNRVKMLVLSTSCVAVLFALSDFVGPVNPVWLLSAIAMGYTIFRAEWKHSVGKSRATEEWKHSVETSRATDLLLEPEPASPCTGTESQRTEWSKTTRTVAFIAVNAACVVALWLVWRIVFRAEDSAPAVVSALAGMAIAAIGALVTTMTPLAFGRPRLDIDHAAATFVVVLVAATVMHLIATPPVMIDSAFGMDAGWKPVLGLFACIGALGVAATTLTGRQRHIHPFMVGIILPAAFLLPSDSFFTFLQREDTLISWAQRLIESGITISLPAIMWYVFGPGRRTAPSHATGTDHRDKPR